MKPAIRAERLRDLFWRLLEIYSPSGKEEAALAYLEEFLAREGCPYGVQPVDEDRYNLILGRTDGGLLFLGHVDTVSAWDLEELGPEERAGWIRGLGAADMKGGCAALVEAYLALRSAGRGRSCGLALVVGEEEEGDGAAVLLDEVRPARALVGEPTDLRLCAGHYGYLEVVIAARGRRAHASLPERGANAAEAVLAVLHRLLQDPSWREEGGAVISIRHLETSNPGFAVPARASAWLDVHLPPGYPAAGVKDRVERAVREAGREWVSVAYPTEHEGFRVAEDEPLVAAYRSLGGRGLEVFRSHSDANRLHEAGIPTVLLGPGSLEYAHTEEEGVPYAQVEEAARWYVDLALAVGD